MARDHAKLRYSIWDDADYIGLSHGAQWLYQRVLSHSTLSYCGVADWRPGRLAKSSSTMTTSLVEELALELEEGLFLVIDRESEEALVRSWVKHDDLMGKWNLAAALAREWSDIASIEIKGVVVHELAALKKQRPEFPNWEREDIKHLLGRPMIAPSKAIENLKIDPANAPSIAPSIDPHIAPPNGAIAAPSIDPPNGGALLPTTYYPLPTTPSPESKDSGKAASTKRKSQLPKDWKPNAKHHDKAKAAGLEPSTLFMEFTDYHLARASTFANWDSAFNTWINNAVKFQRPQASQAKAEPRRGMPPKRCECGAPHEIVHYDECEHVGGPAVPPKDEEAT